MVIGIQGLELVSTYSVSAEDPETVVLHVGLQRRRNWQRNFIWVLRSEGKMAVIKLRLSEQLWEEGRKEQRAKEKGSAREAHLHY